MKTVSICQGSTKKVSKIAKLNLTKLRVEAMRLEGKSKSSFAYPPKRRRKQNKQVKTSLLISCKNVEFSNSNTF